MDFAGYFKVGNSCFRVPRCSDKRRILCQTCFVFNAKKRQVVRDVL